MNLYDPGNTARIKVSITQLQADGTYQPVNVSPLTITVVSADGSQQTAPAIVNDATGAYHADFPIPVTGRAGRWPYRWQTTSATPGLNGLGPGAFSVRSLDF